MINRDERNQRTVRLSDALDGLLQGYRDTLEPPVSLKDIVGGALLLLWSRTEEEQRSFMARAHHYPAMEPLEAQKAAKKLRETALRIRQKLANKKLGARSA